MSQIIPEKFKFGSNFALFSQTTSFKDWSPAPGRFQLGLWWESKWQKGCHVYIGGGIEWWLVIGCKKTTRLLRDVSVVIWCLVGVYVHTTKASSWRITGSLELRREIRNSEILHLPCYSICRTIGASLANNDYMDRRFARAPRIWNSMMRKFIYDLADPFAKKSVMIYCC